jgi:hypothetical protein
MFCTDFEKAFDNSETFEMLDSTKISQSIFFCIAATAISNISLDNQGISLQKQKLL